MAARMQLRRPESQLKAEADAPKAKADAVEAKAATDGAAAAATKAAADVAGKVTEKETKKKAAAEVFFSGVDSIIYFQSVLRWEPAFAFGFATRTRELR